MKKGLYALGFGLLLGSGAVSLSGSFLTLPMIIVGVALMAASSLV